MPARILYVPVALNLLLLALYAWAATETTVVEVSVQGDRLVGTVNGYQLAVEESAAGGDGIGLYLAGAEEGRAYSGAGPAAGSPLAWAGALAARLREEPLGPAWQQVTVSDGAGHTLYDLPLSSGAARDWTSRVALVGWSGPPAGWGGWSQYTVRASLRRGVTPAGELVKARDAANGMLLLVRPEFRDLTWWRLSNGQWEGPLATGFWSKTAWSMLQDDLRLLLVTQQAVLAAILALLGLCWVAGRFAGDAGQGDEGEPPWTGLAAGQGRPARPYGARAAPWRSEGSRPHDQEMPRSAQRDRPPRLWARFGNALCGPWPVVLLALAVTGVAAYVAVVLLEAMPHVQDDVTYLFQARVMALGRLWVPASPIPEAFEQEFIVNYAGRAFGKYPPGQSLMLLPGVLAGVPWLINPLQAGLTVLVTCLIGREVYGKGTGLLAALLVATSPFFIFMSGSFMAHPTGLLFISLFVWLFVKSAKGWEKVGPHPQPPLLRRGEGGTRTALLGGLALGFAFLTRPYTAVAIAAPFALYAGYQVVRSRGGELRRYGPIVVGLAPMVLALLAYDYALTGSALQNPMELWWRFDKIGFGPGVGISGMHSVSDGLWNSYRNLTELMKHLYGWPAFLTLALALVPFLTLRAGRWDWLLLTGWLALVVAHVAWWADGVMYGPRYYYETLGLLALLTARGAGILAQMAFGKQARGRTEPSAPTSAVTPRGVCQILTRTALGRRAAVAKTVVSLFVVALIGYNLAYYLPVQWSLHKGYNYVNGEALRAVSTRQIHHGVVFVDLGQWYEWWNYGAVFPANTPTLDGDIVYARDRGAVQNERVMELYPGRRYYRLSGTAIEEIE